MSRGRPLQTPQGYAVEMNAVQPPVVAAATCVNARTESAINTLQKRHILVKYSKRLFKFLFVLTSLLTTAALVYITVPKNYDSSLPATSPPSCDNNTMPLLLIETAAPDAPTNAFDVCLYDLDVATLYCPSNKTFTYLKQACV